ncbi:MAG: PEP-CTERM sorting domain-containing protein [Phycisphaeraceae bacterium]|nr:PEP-CTERM sorting domain-containing protein [Phycisphaeraceae bacterium]
MTIRTTDSRALRRGQIHGRLTGAACVVALSLGLGPAIDQASAALLTINPEQAISIEKGSSEPGGAGNAGDPMNVKNAGTDRRGKKVWLQFDISDLDFAAAPASSLSFNIVSYSNTNRVGETFTFAVYGMTDQALDFWAQNVTWMDAPGNDVQNGFESSGPSVNPANTTLLGTFDVVGNDTGTFSINGGALADFINADTNNTLTMILLSQSDLGIPGPDVRFAKGIDQADPAQSDIVLTIVPEPASLALMGIGGLLLLRRRHNSAA